MKLDTDGKNVGIRWNDGSHLCDLDFTEENTLICDSQGNMQDLTTAVELETSKTGLRENWAKCKVMPTGPWDGHADNMIIGYDNGI
jgi:hypothetical protein